jgi:urease accessory protein
MSVVPAVSAQRLPLMPEFIRARAAIELELARSPGTQRTSLTRLYETGGLRLRFPKTAAATCEGVIMNTSGGIAGGDVLTIDCRLSDSAQAVLTTQSAEKIYRADSIDAQMHISLNLAAQSTLAWLPQEAILFDGARLARRLNVAMTGSATLTILEMVVFGRTAATERLGSGALRDQWRVRRDGKLIFAEAVKLDGPLADVLERPAVARGARAVATLLHIAPQVDSRLDGLRHHLTDAKSDCGASCFNGIILARFASADATRVRTDARRAAEYIHSGTMPRVWSC